MSPSYILFGMILCWNTLIEAVVNHSNEVDLLHKLNHFYGFDHNLILMESPIDDEMNNIPSPSLVPQTLYVIKNISNDRIKIRPNSESKKTLMIIFLTIANLERNLNVLTKMKSYQRVNTNVKIGLFFRQAWPTRLELMELFQWCWRMSIVNIFVAYPGVVEQPHDARIENPLAVYTFNPFGLFELIDLTGSESMSNYFPKICSNLRQHSLRIALYKDINSLIYTEGNPNFGGPDGKLWQTIFRVTNATYTLVEFLEINEGQHIPNLALNGTIDLGIQPFTPNVKEPIYLYPIYMETVLLIVPTALPYSEFTTYLQTFLDDATFVVTLITIPVLITALTIIRYMKRKRLIVFQSAADIVNLFLNDNLAIAYRKLFRVESFIIVPLTLAGFVNINMLLSILTSYLTRPMDQPEINTFADIERSPFPVLVPAKRNKDYLVVQFKEEFNLDWGHKMVDVSLEEFFHQILTFNTSICFIYFGTAVKNLLEYQKRLHIPGFRIPTQIISKTIAAYVAPVDFPLRDCFNEKIQLIMNAGLYWKWRDESYYEFVERDYFPEGRPMPNKRGSEKYYVPIFIVYGWIGSVVVLLVEIVCKKFEIWLKKISRKH